MKSEGGCRLEMMKRQGWRDDRSSLLLEPINDTQEQELIRKSESLCINRDAVSHKTQTRKARKNLKPHYVKKRLAKIVRKFVLVAIFMQLFIAYSADANQSPHIRRRCWKCILMYIVSCIHMYIIFMPSAWDHQDSTVITSCPVYHKLRFLPPHSALLPLPQWVAAERWYLWRMSMCCLCKCRGCVGGRATTVVCGCDSRL